MTKCLNESRHRIWYGSAVVRKVSDCNSIVSLPKSGDIQSYNVGRQYWLICNTISYVLKILDILPFSNQFDLSFYYSYEVL